MLTKPVDVKPADATTPAELTVTEPMLPEPSALALKKGLIITPSSDRTICPLTVRLNTSVSPPAATAKAPVAADTVVAVRAPTLISPLAPRLTIAALVLASVAPFTREKCAADILPALPALAARMEI